MMSGSSMFFLKRLIMFLKINLVLTDRPIDYAADNVVFCWSRINLINVLFLFVAEFETETELPNLYYTKRVSF